MYALLHRVRRVSRIVFAVAAAIGCSIGLANAAPAHAQSEQTAHAAKRKSDFSLLPNSLRKNPEFCETVFTELTPVGKKLPVATPDHPQYYVLQFAGFDRLFSPPSTSVISPHEIEDILRRSLAKAGYVESDATHAATLLIFFTWGSTSQLNGSGPSPVELFLSKASLVGGDGYEKTMKDLLKQKASQIGPYGRLDTNPNHWRNSSDILDPFKMYEKRSDRNEFLLDQVTSPLYFIVTSAYDYQSAAAKKRVLLWRTRMTVDASGVSDDEAFPSLVAVASPCFGRETVEPRAFRRRSGEPVVEIGTPVIVDDSATTRAVAHVPDKR